MEGASDNAAAAATSALTLVDKAATLVEGEEDIPISSSLMENSIRSAICAICLEKIVLQETALVKGCEQAYCVTCILRWASYSSKQPSCPQCKLPFEFLVVHRTLDGRIVDYMFDESVCLLHRTHWFVPLSVPADSHGTIDHDLSQYHGEDTYADDGDDVDDVDDYYVTSRLSSRLFMNRRWGENGYIKAGRKEARPVTSQDGLSSSSSRFKGKAMAGESKVEAAGVAVGRRAKRVAKREAADKAAAARHRHHLEKLGRI